MPPTIRMSLSNGNNPTFYQIAALKNANLVSVPTPKANTPLSAPMIGRINNTKSGCGGCGRH